MAVQGQVHQILEVGILRAHCKTETDAFMFAEVRHAQARQVTAIELIVSGDGIADEHVSLPECYGIEGLGRRTEGQEFGLGI
ncbi:hypothetical protein D3C81_1948650 [compost metagenome]